VTPSARHRERRRGAGGEVSGGEVSDGEGAIKRLLALTGTHRGRRWRSWGSGAGTTARMADTAARLMSARSKPSKPEPQLAALAR
jgi:hypothetical protein